MVDALKTSSQTDIVSFAALVGAAIALFLMGDVIGASGGSLTFLPGTEYAVNLEEYLLVLLGGSVLLAYTYNGQEFSELEAADGFFAAIGIGLIASYHYVDQVANAVQPYEPWSGLAITLLGAGAVYIVGFGSDGGILG